MTRAVPVTRHDLGTVTAYGTGRAGQDVAARFWLGANEPPLPPLPGVQEAIARCAPIAHRYPEIAAYPLRRAIAERLDVPVEHVVAGAGSVVVLRDLVHAYAGPGDEVVFGWRSYEAYPIIVGTCGARAVAVPLDRDHRHDLSALWAAITGRTKVVIVCNPNNPTGTVLAREDLDAFLAAVPDEVVVVVDEAYREYVRDGDREGALRSYRRRDNVVVLRTFSKAYGLAGLRVGYAVAPTSVARTLSTVAPPFPVGVVAHDAAIAGLAARPELLRRAGAVADERDRLRAALEGLGYDVPDSRANFVWLPLGRATADLHARLLSAGIVTRPFAGEGLRITIGAAEADDAVLDVAARFAAERRNIVGG